MNLNLTNQEAIDLLAIVENKIRMGEEDRWTDSMVPSLRVVRDQLVAQGIRDVIELPGGLESR